MLSERAIVLIVFLAWTLISMSVGASIYAYTHKPEAVKREAVQGQVRQDDGSVIAARVPLPADKMPAAPHKLPKGAKVDGQVSITVKPNPPLRQPEAAKPDVQGNCPLQKLDCPAVRVDLSLIHDKEGRKVVASSPDGEVVTSLYVPVELPPAQRVGRWSAGPTYSPHDKTWGAYADRDIGPLFRAGVEAHDTPDDGLTYRLRVGLRF